MLKDLPALMSRVLREEGDLGFGRRYGRIERGRTISVRPSEDDLPGGPQRTGEHKPEGHSYEGRTVVGGAVIRMDETRPCYDDQGHRNQQHDGGQGPGSHHHTAHHSNPAATPL
jgi:hypothetical protein